MQEQTPQVLITDREMPGLDGLQLCRRIRAAEHDSYTYIVLLTSHGDSGDVLSGMHAGADDYVSKPLSLLSLEAALLAAARVTALHDDLATVRAELSRQARTDPLTGLGNRLSLTDDLQQLWAASERYDRSYCVALVDIDHFKRYNDRYGHQAGDRALRAVSATLVGHARSADRVYRFGGEEFLLLLPEQALEGGTIAAERIRAAVEALGMVHADTDGGLLTVSVGLAASTPQCRALDSEALIGCADLALYRAKEQGRNRLVVAPSSMAS